MPDMYRSISGAAYTFMLVSVASQAVAQSDVINVREKQLGPYRPKHTTDFDQACRLIIEGTNRFRGEHEREPVTSSAKLTKAAQELADFMARTDLYGHQADGKTPSERIEAADYRFCLNAENIAFYFQTDGYATKSLASAAVDGWINSPPHRENMLKPHVTEIGVGVAQSEVTGAYYAVQVFGRPLSAALTIKVRNDTGRPVSYEVGPQEYQVGPRQIMTHQVCTPQPFRVVGAVKSLTPADGDTLSATVMNGSVALVEQANNP